MQEVITITEAKAKFSEIVNRICVSKEKIAITRKGKPAVVLLHIEEYEKMKNQGNNGLVRARGALAGFDTEIDKMTESIYEEREKETSRKVSL